MIRYWVIGVHSREEPVVPSIPEFVGCGERANRIGRRNAFAIQIAIIAGRLRRCAVGSTAMADISIDAVRCAYRILRGLKPVVSSRESTHWNEVRYVES
jgi:hypothetical protein